MYGYKPPHTARVTIQPYYYGVWGRTWRNGSIVAIAPEFIYEKFRSLDKQEKYQYVLDVVHGAMIQLSEEYNWDRSVFENAYKKIIDANFIFSADYPLKMSRNKATRANLRVEKTETITTVLAVIHHAKEVHLYHAGIRVFDFISEFWGEW